MIGRRQSVVLALLVLLMPLLAATASARQDAPSMIPELNLGGFGGGASPQINFNPYSSNSLAGKDYVFETLYVTNGFSCERIPWLATGYEWRDPQTLVFTMRDGVTWTDGTPFTAADVAFSYDLIMRFPALDLPGIGSSLASVTASHPTVTLAFKEPAIELWHKATALQIVPKHLWQDVEDPVTFVNEEPVGTGPFVFESFNGQQLNMARNETYWQADAVRIERLVYKGSEQGQIDQLKLAEGEYDWNAMFIPDIEQTYVAKDPEHNKYWFPPGGIISLYGNVTKPPFDDVQFRRAVAHAIDREEIAQKAQFGYVQTASQTGLLLPNQQQFLDESIPNEGKIPYDPVQAEKILADAGYAKDGEGRLLGKDGEPVTFAFTAPNGWNDWVQAAQIIRDDLAAVGITMDVQTITPEIAIDDRQSGNFDATFGVHNGTCNMYNNFFSPLASASTKPIGEEVLEAGNAVRWQDPETDGFINQLRSIDDPEAQKPALYGLQQIMVNEFPVIPLWYGAIWFQYRTEKAVGWPSADDPYASPNNGVLIVTRLRPAQ
jgi:peptide/nickel transport system substrate-binding protein